MGFKYAQCRRMAAMSAPQGLFITSAAAAACAHTSFSLIGVLGALDEQWRTLPAYNTFAISHLEALNSRRKKENKEEFVSSPFERRVRTHTIRMLNGVGHVLQKLQQLPESKAEYV